MLLSRCTCINKGRERGEEEEEEEGERRRRFNFVPSSAAASAPNRKLFIKNKSKKPHKTHQTPRKHIKRLFVLGFFYWLVWFIFLGWVGFGFETPTANTDVTLPSLNELVTGFLRNLARSLYVHSETKELICLVVVKLIEAL